MSFDDKVQRKKSTRWVRASTANYDGDDWVEEEYYENEEDEVPPVPELPTIPPEHLKGYESTTNALGHKDATDEGDDNDDDLNSFDDTAKSPQINMRKFQNIDLDDQTQQYEDLEEEKQQEVSPVDEYADIIRDDSEEEEDYKPQSSSRFQPLPISPDEQSFDQVSEPMVEQTELLPASKREEEEEEELIEAQSSAFQPFPQEEIEQKVEIVEHVIDEITAPDLEDNHVEPFVSSMKSNENVNATKEPIVESTAEKEFESNVNEVDVLIDESPSSIQYSGNEGVGSPSVEVGGFPLEKKENLEAPHIIINDLALQVQDSEDEEDEYVPTTNRFKSSVLEDEEEIAQPELNKYNEAKIVQEIDELEPESRTEPENEAEKAKEEEIGYRPAQYPEEERYEHENDLPTASHGIQVERRESPVVEYQNHLSPSRPSHNQDFGDISDTDTLHIQDPEDPGSPSIEEIRRELSNTSLHDLPPQHDFTEHAYLGSLIHTPDLDDNDGRFQPVEHSDQELDEIDEIVEMKKEVSNVDNDKGPRIVSQYYSSVNDYFDDYADTSDNETQKTRDSRASVQSSGSLSTGSFSIKSESIYRYSRTSDRESSLNQSTSEFQSMIPDNATQMESTNNQSSGGESNLNPALSINFGHWRPDTDSFRDQFISGTAPPLPTIDNYTRNSMGEIVEDGRSFMEKEGKLDTSDGASISKNDAESNDIFKDEKNDKSLDSIENTISTADTDSNSVIVETKHGDSYKTESNSVLPLHIPLNTPDSKDQPQGQYFHEKLTITESNLPSQDTASSKLNITKISGNKRTNYVMKQISTISDPIRRIDALRNARTEEANLELGLCDWLLHAESSPNVESYKSNVHNSHVAQAYADASTMARKHTLSNNVNSFLHKRRVFQDTSSTAQSLAKGIFTRGKKILKSDN